MTETIHRRELFRRGAILGGGLASLGPLSAYYARAAEGAPLSSAGYGPLVDKGDLFLPEAFSYTVISRQGEPLDDGSPTPGIFDGMGAYRAEDGKTILIRNHENRERAGEIKVVTGPDNEYNPEMFGGNTKLVIDVRKAGRDQNRQPIYEFDVLERWAILGGTSTNCAGGLLQKHKWITCEEVVKRGANGTKHGYIFEIDARASGPVQARPVIGAGRMSHEAALEWKGIVYQSEDRSIASDPVTGQIGACFYRYVPDGRRWDNLAYSTGVLQALKVRGEWLANMDVGRPVGSTWPVEWVTIDEPDHEDDTDNRRDRVSGFTPTRVQAADKGAAIFDRMEGMWAEDGDKRIYVDCTTGGALNLGQVWAYDPREETLTLIYESTDAALLDGPDNVIIVPQTGDVILQEDAGGDQFLRGVTTDGQIYDFAKSAANETEFCGGCFDPSRKILYMNQQGERGDLPFGPPDGQAVTYAIWGPWGKREED
jgi:secreted PhoX family phosphatase